jgi:hypothetical protein
LRKKLFCSYLNIRLGLYPNQNSVTKSKRYLNAIGVRKVGPDYDREHEYSFTIYLHI